MGALETLWNELTERRRDGIWSLIIGLLVLYWMNAVGKVTTPALDAMPLTLDYFITAATIVCFICLTLITGIIFLVISFYTVVLKRY